MKPIRFESTLCPLDADLGERFLSADDVLEEQAEKVVAVGVPIIAGRRYTYTAEIPRGCAGQEYRVHRFVLDVPSYQQKVLVEALTGNDAGLWFVCSLENFARRYKIVEG